MSVSLGKKGETLACEWLKSQGYSIVERNWRSKRGEIDIIAIEGQTLVFIEVKNWPHGELEDLERVVGKIKQKRIVETAKYFLLVNRQYNSMFLRFDLIFLDWNAKNGHRASLKHIKDAFSEFCE